MDTYEQERKKKSSRLNEFKRFYHAFQNFQDALLRMRESGTMRFMTKTDLYCEWN